jgi:hypothetical protein
LQHKESVVKQIEYLYQDNVSGVIELGLLDEKYAIVGVGTVETQESI